MIVTVPNFLESYIQSSSTCVIYFPNPSSLQLCNFLHIRYPELNHNGLLPRLLQYPLHFLLVCNFALSLMYLQYFLMYRTYLFPMLRTTYCSIISLLIWKNKSSHLYLKRYLPCTEFTAMTPVVSHFTSSLPNSPCMPQPYFSGMSNLPLGILIFICVSFCWRLLWDICTAHCLTTFGHLFRFHLVIHLFCQMWAHACI